MNTRKIYQRIAKKYGTTPLEVEKEMQKAIQYAFDNSDKNKRKELQEQIGIKERVPEVEDILIFAKKKVEEKKLKR